MDAADALVRQRLPPSVDPAPSGAPQQAASQKKQKAIIMRSNVANTALGKAFLSQFEVRFGPSLQADVIIPGPPTSWAFLVLEDLVAEKMLGAASRLDRMVNMFQHAIVVCIKPSPEAMRRLQRHLAEAGTKHLGTKLLLFPDTASAASSVLDMCPMLLDVSRRQSQLRFVDQLREDSYLGPEVVVKALENLIFKGNVDELVKKDANLLVDRFGSLANVLSFGRVESFASLQADCPLEESTISRLDFYFSSQRQPPRHPIGSSPEAQQYETREDFEGSTHFEEGAMGSGDVPYACQGAYFQGGQMAEQQLSERSLQDSDAGYSYGPNHGEEGPWKHEQYSHYQGFGADYSGGY